MTGNEFVACGFAVCDITNSGGKPIQFVLRRLQYSSNEADMTYLQLIAEIIELLEGNDEIELADLIRSHRDTSFTAGELLSSITYILMHCIKANTALSDLIGDNVNQLNTICVLNGIFVRR